MITLNARFSTQNQTGVQRVAYELGRRLLARRSDVVAVSPSAPLAEYEIPVSVASSVAPTLGGHFWEQTTLRRLASNGDALINLGGTGPIGMTRQIVMIYDVNYLLGPEGFSWKFRTFYSHLQRHLAHRAKICTISQWSAETIGKAFDVPPESMAIVPLAADHLDQVTADAGTLQRYGIENRPYFLCVGSANPNKNFATALAAYRLLENPKFDLVIVGGNNPAIFQNEKAMEKSPNVHRLPHVSDGELKELLRRSRGLLVPSLLEGFGIPAIEAMHLGTPAIVSRAAAIPEVCGDAALYFDPLDAPALARTMGEVFDKPELAQRMRERGLKHVRKYSWDKSADVFEGIIEDYLRS